MAAPAAPNKCVSAGMLPFPVIVKSITHVARFWIAPLPVIMLNFWRDFGPELAQDFGSFGADFGAVVAGCKRMLKPLPPNDLQMKTGSAGVLCAASNA